MLSLTLKGFLFRLVLAFALLFFRDAGGGAPVCVACDCFVLVRFALCESRIYEVFDRVFIDTLRPQKIQNAESLVWRGLQSIFRGKVCDR